MFYSKEIPEGVRRQANWKKEVLVGDMERQGKHILHSMEKYNRDGLSFVHFYFTSPYNAIDEVVYNAKTMRQIWGPATVPPGRGYLPHAIAANAVSLGYILTHDITKPLNLAIGLLLLSAGQKYKKNVRDRLWNERKAWDEYRKYATSLQSVPKPSALDVEALA